MKFLFLFITIAICGCGFHEGKNKQIHPNFSSTELEKFDKLIVENYSSDQISKISKRLKKHEFKKDLTIDLILGTISDVKLNSDGTVYLLDQDQLYIFKLNNNKIDTLGRKGSGPEEMIFPSSMEIMNDGGIMLADYNKGLIRIVSNQQEKHRDFIIPESYSDLKFTGDGFYLRKAMILQPNPYGYLKTIDYYDLKTDTIKFSLGDAYLNNNRLAVRNYSSGLIDYNSSSKILISNNKHSPIVTAFRKDTIVWEKQIDDFISFEMISWDEPVKIEYHKKFTKQNKPFDELVTLESVTDGVAIIQVLRGSRSELANNKMLKSYLIDVKKGLGIEIDSLPKIVAFSKNMFVGEHFNPNQSFHLYDY